MAMAAEHGYWSMTDMLDFIQRAREEGLDISMSPGDAPFSVMNSNGRHASVVRFWWNGRVDCRKGGIPSFDPPEWLDEGNHDEWYRFIGMRKS